MTKAQTLTRSPLLRKRVAGNVATLALGSGIFVWNFYRDKQMTARTALAAPHFELNHHSYPEEPEYVHLLEPVIEMKDELKSLVPRQLRKPWKLLRSANNGDYEQHLTAVKELASLGSLNPGEFRQIAQSSSLRTAVGLARCGNPDLRFFLPMPKMPDKFQSTPISQLLKELLSDLPPAAEDVHECVRKWTSTALDNYVPGADDDFLTDSDLNYEFQRESHHFHSIPRRKYSEKLLIEFCLQALLSHSTIPKHCSTMIKSCHCLPIFARIIRDHPDNARIKSLIGKILANLALDPLNHDFLFSSGWVGKLAEWKQDPNLLVNLPAAKALCNMDQVFFGGELKSGIYQLLPETRSVKHLHELTDWGVDVVFIHGLLGGVFYSWRQLDEDNSRGWGTSDLISTDKYSYCWPRDWLQEVSNDDHVRVFGVDFDTYLSQWGNACPSETFKRSLKERSEDILQKLLDAGIGRRGPVVFVGHSMGGLIIKQMLVEAKERPAEDVRAKRLASNARGIVFYSTPHRGSRVAKLNSYSKFLFFPSVEVQDLEADSVQLHQLQESFLSFVKDEKTDRDKKFDVISFGESKATPYMGIDLTFVPPDSSDPGVGDHEVIRTNHMNICKPGDKKSVLYKKVRNLVKKSLDEATPFD